MAEEGTLCVREDVMKKAGLKASATSTAEGYTNIYIKMAEGFICASSRYDWVTNIASVSSIGKEMLRECAASWAAIDAVEYDMSGFTSREEAEIVVDILWAQVVECINLLRDENFRQFVLEGEF